VLAVCYVYFILPGVRAAGDKILAREDLPPHALAVTSGVPFLLARDELEPSARSSTALRGSKVDAPQFVPVVSSGIQITPAELLWLWRETNTMVAQHSREVDRRKVGSEGELMAAILFGRYVTQAGLVQLFKNNAQALPSDVDCTKLQKRCEELMSKAREGFKGKLPVVSVDLEDLNRKMDTLAVQFHQLQQLVLERVQGAAASLPMVVNGER